MPPNDESQLDHSKDHTKYVSGGTLGMLLETAKRWGIFAGIVVALIGWVLWLTGSLLQRDSDREQYIRTELGTMVKESTASNVKVADSVEEFKESTDELTEAIEDLTKSQTENPE